MKIFVKTLSGAQFQIHVNPEDTVDDVKRNIENVRGADVYPKARQMLVFRGKFLEDGTTILDENKVTNGNSIVLMLGKVPHTDGQPHSSTPRDSFAPTASTLASPPRVLAPVPATTMPALSDGYGTAASVLTMLHNFFEENVRKLIDIGRGKWDRANIIRALMSDDGPVRAVEYLLGVAGRAKAPPVRERPSPASVQAAANPPTQSQPSPVPSPAVLRDHWKKLFEQEVRRILDKGRGECDRATAIRSVLSNFRSGPVRKVEDVLRGVRDRVNAQPARPYPASGQAAANPPAQSQPSPVPAVLRVQRKMIRRKKYEEKVRQIVGLGRSEWDRASVIRALRNAARKGPGTTVEDIFRGVRKLVEAPPVRPSPASGQAAAIPPTQSQPAPVPSSGPNTAPLNLFPRDILDVRPIIRHVMDQFRSNPQFHEVRAEIQANPEMLPFLLQAIWNTLPGLYSLIQANPAPFIAMMKETEHGGVSGPSDQVDNAAARPNAVTPEDRAAIYRLVAMGFRKRAFVAQVYFACNRNEELAANYLIDHHHTDDHAEE